MTDKETLPEYVFDATNGEYFVVIAASLKQARRIVNKYVAEINELRTGASPPGANTPIELTGHGMSRVAVPGVVWWGNKR